MATLFLRRAAANGCSLLPTRQHHLPSSSSSLILLKASNSHQYVATRSFFFFNEKENNRITDIVVNDESIGSRIKPGNLVDKFYEKTGNTRTLPVELAHGYFWMVADLKKTEGKPTLSNDYLIPAKNAQPFPSLTGVSTLSGESVELPQFFVRKNRSEDENAQCTLVAMAGRDHGFKMLKSWTKPFEDVFQDQERVEVVHLHLTEGWFSANLLQSLISGMIKKNTPVEEHDTTVLCFRKDLEEFRDSLRMHNVICGYVFLLDGVGRIRFAGSGEATPEDVEKIIDFANELTPLVRPKEKSNRNSKQKIRQ